MKKSREIIIVNRIQKVEDSTGLQFKKVASNPSYMERGFIFKDKYAGKSCYTINRDAEGLAVSLKEC